MVKQIFSHFFAKVERSTMFCFIATEATFSAWNLFKPASYGKVSFSTPDLDGKASERYVLSEKHKRWRSVCLVVPRVVNFSVLILNREERVNIQTYTASLASLDQTDLDGNYQLNVKLSSEKN